MPAKSQYDYSLFFCVIFLLCIGLIFIYSASSNIAFYRFGDPYMYIKRQALFCLFGLVAMFIAMHLPIDIYSKKWVVYALLFLSIMFLVSLFFIGHRTHGAVRWIRIGSFSFQPSEIAKLSLCLYLAYSMSQKGIEMSSFKKGILPHMIIIGIFIILIARQPDHGTALMIAAWLFLMLFVGGCNKLHLLMILFIITPCIILYLSHSSYIITRWKAFLDPWAYPDTYGFQIIHSLYAFGSGGIFGAGLGGGKQKLFYLPEPHTDFILPVIGEETGFVGVLFVVLLYLFIVIKGLQISSNTRNLFNKYLAFGIISMFTLQVLINMAVSMNLAPAKGITLPLLSYGGSSLTFTMLEIGILLNVSAKR